MMEKPDHASIMTLYGTRTHMHNFFQMKLEADFQRFFPTQCIDFAQLTQLTILLDLIL
jgi:hypothetical protein